MALLKDICWALIFSTKICFPLANLWLRYLLTYESKAKLFEIVNFVWLKTCS